MHVFIGRQATMCVRERERERVNFGGVVIRGRQLATNEEPSNSSALERDRNA